MGAAVIVRRAVLWLDDRLAIAPFLQHALRKAFPDHWSFMLGEIAAYCYLILVATGIFIGLAFDPSGTTKVYHGTYRPLEGQTVSAAYASTVSMSLAMTGGLLVRQMHHWAANVFLAAIVAHGSRIFFTGAFRKPREINWLIGVTLILLAMGAGFTGYSLPDDMLSGTGLRIAISVGLSIPFVGAWLTGLAVGGPWPQPQLTGRLFFLHVFLLQALIATAIGTHVAIIWRQKHTQFRGPGRTADNVVGSPLWPHYAFKSIALGLAVAAAVAMLGAFAEINPVWQYGGYKPAIVASPAQPDWYVGWLEGALRLWPPWSLHVFGHMIPAIFFPGVCLPMLYFGTVYAWPFIERALTRDRARHELLNHPFEVPWRTGAGVAALTFVAVLELAGSDDVFARFLHVPVEGLLLTYRILALALPVVAGALALSISRELGKRHQHPGERSGTTAIIVRNARGGYDAMEKPS
jgi:ubiquinol-cytochrome c reductase cytochrome b subunit